MSAVGMTSIALGVLMVSSRASLLVAPGATLRWFDQLIETDGKIRAFGAFVSVLGAVLVWAGSTEGSSLAMALLVLGWPIIGMGVLTMLLFPNVYRGLASAFLPAPGETRLSGWRLMGLLGTAVGVLMIALGIREL